jgi:hypothetical protein
MLTLALVTTPPSATPTTTLPPITPSILPPITPHTTPQTTIRTLLRTISAVTMVEAEVLAAEAGVILPTTPMRALPLHL